MHDIQQVLRLLSRLDCTLDRCRTCRRIAQKCTIDHAKMQHYIREVFHRNVYLRNVFTSVIDEKLKMVSQVESRNTLLCLRDIRLVAADMDGTLLGPGSILPQCTFESVNRMETTTGIPLVLATGRCRSAAFGRLSGFGESFTYRAGIFLNGAYVCDSDGTVVHEECFDLDIVNKVVSLFPDRVNSIAVMPISGDLIFAPQENDVSMYMYRKYADPCPTIFNGYLDMLSYLKKSQISIHMISISTSEGIEDEVYQSLRACLPNFTIVRPIPRLVTILPRNSSKGSGLAALSKYFGISQNGVAAVGDADNDLEMLNWAGVSVAMGNAKECCKAIADLVVNSNDHPTLPGVAQFLNMITNSRRYMHLANVYCMHIWRNLGKSTNAKMCVALFNTQLKFA